MSNHNASTRDVTSGSCGQFQARRQRPRTHTQIGLALVALALGACGGADDPADAPVVDAGHKAAHKDAGGSGTSGSGNSGTGSATTPATAGTSGTKKDAGVVAPPDKTAADSTWCAVEPLVQTHCQSCHGAKQLYGAPMPLLTASDFQASSKTDGST